MASPTVLYGRQYEDNIQIGVQQIISKLRDTVIIKSGVKGKSKAFGYVDSVDAREKTSRLSETVWDDPSANRVTAYLTKIYKALEQDETDALATIADPKSAYTTVTLAALRRKIDSQILAAARGTKYTGENGTTSSSLPSAQKIAASSAGLTMAKLISTLELFNGADVDENETKYLVIGAQQVSDLLGITQFTSADYNTIKTLVPGKVVDFMGFKMIMSNLLTKASTTRYCLAWAKSGIGLAIGQDIKARVDELQTKHYDWATYAEMYTGATRIQDEKIVEVACIES